MIEDTAPRFQPFGFAGGLYDQDTKLVHFGARDYDAEVGRWTTKDPAGLWVGNTNSYEYVGSDPVNFVDALGLEMDGSRFGMGKRSQRFSMVVENGVIKELNVEEPGAFSVSSAEHVLKQL